MWQSFAALNLSTESTFILARVGTENGSKVQFRQSTAETEQKLARRNRSCVSPTKTVKSLFRSYFFFLQG